MKAGPLSNPITLGDLNLGTISSSIIFATITAVSLLVGKASAHPEKVSTKTHKYLYPFFSSLDFSKVYFPKDTSPAFPGSFSFPNLGVAGIYLLTNLVSFYNFLCQVPQVYDEHPRTFGCLH